MDQIPLPPLPGCPRTWAVYSLDVWGNAADGFEVNDRSRAGTITISDDATDADIIGALVDADFLVANHRCGIDDDGDDRYMGVSIRSSGRPVFQLERKD